MKLFFLSLVLLFFGCKTGTEIYYNNEVHQVPFPPNMAKVSENFFADKTEITNIDYKEYLFDLTQLYGKGSAEYWEALPDSTIWREKISYGEPYLENYFHHPAYDNCPVVGVNLAQAKKFAEWRTEVVVEILLFNRGLIRRTESRRIEDRFTIKKYQEGNHEWIIKREEIMIPVFKIPSILEWEELAGVHSPYEFGVDSLTRYNKKVLRKYKGLFYTQNIMEFSGHTPLPVQTLADNIYGLKHVIGNVSELVDAEQIVKGGDWMQDIHKISIKKNQPFDQPSYKVGFRNVCRYEMLEIDKN